MAGKGIFSRRNEYRTARRSGGNRKRGPIRKVAAIRWPADKADGIYARKGVILECGHEDVVYADSDSTRCMRCWKEAQQQKA